MESYISLCPAGWKIGFTLMHTHTLSLTPSEGMGIIVHVDQTSILCALALKPCDIELKDILHGALS